VALGEEIPAKIDFARGDRRNVPKPNRASPLAPADQTHSTSVPILSQEEQAIQYAIALVHGKWRVAILRQVQSGPIRPGQLRRRLSPISKKVLNQHLRQMEEDLLLVRTDLGGKVPHVEYSLANPLGAAALSLLQMLARWGAQNMQFSARQLR
jgi:DNA-binding HxlR family transcriptional regulator